MFIQSQSALADVVVSDNNWRAGVDKYFESVMIIMSLLRNSIKYLFEIYNLLCIIKHYKEITLKKVKNEIKIVFYFPSCKELLFLLGRNCIQSCVKIIVSYLTRRKGDIMAS